MNRKERRAAQKPKNTAGTASPKVVAQPARAGEPQPSGRRAKAEALYRQIGDLPRHDPGTPQRALELLQRAVALAPDFAEAQNALGSILLAQGRRAEAAKHLERALALTPELYETYGEVLGIFYALYPAIGEAVMRAARAWPTRLGVAALFGADGLALVADNAFLHRLLESHTVCDLDFERFLTSLRPLLADAAAPGGDDAHLLGLCCALARQCFLNDYVFALTPEEEKTAERSRRAVVAALEADQPVAPLRLAALATYGSLGALPVADRLLQQTWPPPLAAVIAQQIIEPRAERVSMSAIARLTPVTDTVSVAVRRQYEENPYPRWLDPASQPAPETLHHYLARSFPAVAILPHEGICEMLVAGCGTGRHPVELARRFSNVRILAIDLSLASLAYAQRKTSEFDIDRIDFAQADILELATIGRMFDAIDAGGVLHHLADPFAGWRVLWSLLRPGGIMRVALYSALARRTIIEARRFVAERGFAPTPDGIRRCREELIATPLRAVAKLYDFFSVSECRDLLFHVQEHQLTLPAIRDFLSGAGACLIGFELPQAVRDAYARRFPADRALTDLNHWHAFEQDHPDTFAGMYQFWLAKDGSG